MAKYWTHVRNHWTGWHSDRWYLFGIGYNIQESRLVCWQLWLFGFCFCLFVENEEPSSRPFPMSFMDWKRRRKYRKPTNTTEG